MRELMLLLLLLLASQYSQAEAREKQQQQQELLETYKAAVAAHQLGELNHALSLYQRVVELNPAVASVHNNMGSILYKLRQLELAESSYAKATALPDCPVEAHLNYCILLSEELGQLAQARLQCLKALASRPDYFQAYQQLGNIEQDMGHITEAKEYFQRAQLLSMTELQQVQASAAELFQWEPTELGFERLVEVTKGEFVTLETLSMDPPVFRVRRFLNTSQIEGLISEAEARLQESQTIGDASRESKTAWLSTHQSDVLLDLAKRVSALTRVPEEVILASEELQVLHYTKGGHFGLHHESTSFLRRFATIVYYLNEVTSGGELCFPSIQAESHGDQTCSTDNSLDTVFVERQAKHADSSTPECTKGLFLIPQAGDAILFYNYNKDGLVNPSAMHAACEVLEGEKWAANHWINLRT